MSDTAIKWLADEVDLGPMDVAGDPGADLDSLPVVELALSDLVQDIGGEVVLYNDSGLRAMGLVAHEAIVGEGEAGPHVTASGADVTGFKFVSFANGLTLYYQDGLDLIVRPA
ncbi:MAG TPA: hypothetical protein VNS22_04135 [Geminicoccus sp.]|uniref:hypothetical protein n=1 Tax=Geminicoccus sp. TaxID=2024832 RepID=UPI002C2F1FBE|nr:hypothetical protein [Geminicoccus sp.]HWL67555.1 hypothetical protein [Geminicoccus sp.]